MNNFKSVHTIMISCAEMYNMKKLNYVYRVCTEQLAYLHFVLHGIAGEF